LYCRWGANDVDALLREWQSTVLEDEEMDLEKWAFCDLPPHLPLALTYSVRAQSAAMLCM
jgi:hypothetical protein